jgi:serine/threonine-protein kinase
MDREALQLGAYRLIARLGAGGMGEVWKAEDTRLGRLVAVKILPQRVAGDPEAIARMRREARTAAQLSHPNIATIHAFEEIDGRVFIVMELVDGEPLTAVIRRGPLAEHEAARIAASIADALSEAHAKGIVHRDIKPDNVMVSGSRVKVLDFGIARQVQSALAPDDPTAFITQHGMIVGTVNYMSPEQALGKELDPRTDVFSLGVVLYEMLSGQMPFRGSSATETITRIVRDEPPPLARASREMAAIVRRCLRKERDARFRDAKALSDALNEHLARLATVLSGSQLETVREPRHAVSRRGKVVGAAVLITLLSLAGAAILQRRERVPAEASQSAARSADPLPATATARTEPAPPSPVPAAPATTSVAVVEEQPAAPPASSPVPPPTLRPRPRNGST